MAGPSLQPAGCCLCLGGLEEDWKEQRPIHPSDSLARIEQAEAIKPVGVASETIQICSAGGAR